MKFIVFSFSTVRVGTCAWIGAATLNTPSRYRWIELPPNYGELTANGELLSETYSDFPRGINLCLI